MQNAILTLAQTIQANIDETNQIHHTARLIEQIARGSDREEVMNGIATLAIVLTNMNRETTTSTPESEQRRYAYHLCQAFIGLCKYGNTAAGTHSEEIA